MNLRLRNLHIILAAMFVVGACSESSFSGDEGKNKKKGQTGLDGSQDGIDGGDGSGGGNNADGGAGAGAGARKEIFTVSASKSVDVVMVVDTSGSMADEKSALEQNMQTLINDLLMKVDAKVTVIGKTTNKTDPMGAGLTFTFPSSLPTDRFTIIDQYVHSTDAIGHLQRYFDGALSTPLPLRDGVPTEVVIITDDNGHNTSNNIYRTPGCTAADFKAPANRKIVINAIVGKEAGRSPINNKCVIEHKGEEHIKLQQQTGGTFLDICEPNWSSLLKQLTQKIIIRNEGFKLGKKPVLTRPIEVKVNGKVVSADNYTVDAENSLLKFKETFVMPDGATIEVTYTGG